MPRRPIVQDRLFDDVDTPLADQIARRFQPWVADELHSFLNTLPCLADVQAIRKRWKTRTGSPEAFGTFKANPRHWYSFNHGGRNEGRLNVGMSPQYFRVGLGFEFTEKQGGNPSPQIDGAQMQADRFRLRYHLPSDDLSHPLDFDAGAKTAKFDFLLGFISAQDDARPRWNDGDFFGKTFGGAR